METKKRRPRTVNKQGIVMGEESIRQEAVEKVNLAINNIAMLL